VPLVSIKTIKHPQKQKPLSFNHFLDLYFSKFDPRNFFFVQIGAHDGRHRDPLHHYVRKYNLRGLAMEPQPAVFDKLKENYRDYPNVICVNAAIAKDSGTMPFYTISDTKRTEANFLSMTSIGALDRQVFIETLKRQLPGASNVDEYVKELSVITLSFDDLVKQHGVVEITMLQMDCEGYDFNILRTIDLNKYRPSMINFESILLSDDDRQECESLLSSFGYKLFRHGYDTCGYRI
jgi:FkbM family methyltransferase